MAACYFWIKFNEMLGSISNMVISNPGNDDQVIAVPIKLVITKFHCIFEWWHGLSQFYGQHYNTRCHFCLFLKYRGHNFLLAASSIQGRVRKFESDQILMQKGWIKEHQSKGKNYFLLTFRPAKNKIGPLRNKIYIFYCFLSNPDFQ